MHDLFMELALDINSLLLSLFTLTEFLIFKRAFLLTFSLNFNKSGFDRSGRSDVDVTSDHLTRSVVGLGCLEHHISTLIVASGIDVTHGNIYLYI